MKTAISALIIAALIGTAACAPHGPATVRAGSCLRDIDCSATASCVGQLCVRRAH